MTFILEDTPGGRDLVVCGPWNDEMADALHEGVADGLTLNYALGFQERDLRFLVGLPLRRLNILARTISDVAPVYGLGETLAELSIQADDRAMLDLTRLPRLRRLAASWRQVKETIDRAVGLEACFLLSFDEADLRALSSLALLSRLVLKDYPSITSLDGLEDLPWLAELGVFLARGLDDISALGRVSSPVLRHLQLEACRGVSSLDPVSGCESLILLNAANCGEIDSLRPVQNLSRLETLYLYESTRILDNDLRPVAALPKLRDFRMQNRRGYAPTVLAIKQLIAERG